MTTTFVISAGDVVISEATGTSSMVADHDKLRQDLREMLSTARDVDNIGAGLEEVINGRPTDQFAVRSELTRRVRRAAETMQSLQTKLHNAERPSNEQLRGLTLLQVSPLQGSRTSYVFRAEFATASGNRTAVTGVVS